MNLKRWLREWNVFLAIMGAVLLTGLITFMAFDGNPGACRQALSHRPGKVHDTWVCDHP